MDRLDVSGKRKGKEKHLVGEDVSRGVRWGNNEISFESSNSICLYI